MPLRRQGSRLFPFFRMMWDGAASTVYLLHLVTVLLPCVCRATLVWTPASPPCAKGHSVDGRCWRHILGVKSVELRLMSPVQCGSSHSDESSWR
jgi:hypothetical protein